MWKNISNKFLWFLLLFFIFLELAFQTFWIGQLGVYISPVVWLLAGIGVCVTAFLLKRKERGRGTKLPRLDNKSLKALLVFGIFAIGSGIIAYFLDGIFREIPVDPMRSDIVPSLELYVKRLLAGEKVYAPLEFPGWTVLPTYFPVLWLPYTFSEVLGIDYRWTAYLVFLLAIFLWNIRLLKKDIPAWEAGLKAALPFLLLLPFVISKVYQVMGMTVELMPAGLYLILVLTLFHRSPWVMAVGILICLMSRYAFTFWLPVYLLAIWVEKGFGKVFRVSLGVALGVAAIYIIPFLSKDWDILSNGLKYYSQTADGQWYPQAWQQEDEKPHHLNQGLSFAIYFYDFADGSVKEKLQLNRKVHLLACAIAALLLMLGYFYFRKKGLDLPFYFLIGLKFYLVIFYGFFYVPFSYLFQLPLMLSIPVVYGLTARRFNGCRMI